jgi:hypothetical protein
MTAVLIVAVGTAVGCGGGGSESSSGSSNEAKIKQAQQSEASAASIHGKLDAALNLHNYAGVDDVFNLTGGGTCSINGIYAGEEAQSWEGDSWVLTSPDKNAAIKVVPFQGTPVSQCLTEVKDVLGW